MTYKSNKIFKTFIAAITFALVLCACLFVGINLNQAAHAADVEWTARVTVMSEGNYVDLASGARITDKNTIYFLVSNFDSQQNPYIDTQSSFSYFISNNLLAVSGLPSSGWEDMLLSSAIDIDGDSVNDTLLASFATVENFDKYIYFRRAYYVPGESGDRYEYYPAYWHIIVNNTLGDSDIGFYTVRATHQLTVNGIVSNPDYKGEWVKGGQNEKGITFTITTSHMNNTGLAFNPSNERLSYSIDGKASSDKTKQWIYLTSNTFSLTNSIAGGAIQFRVTDIAGNYAKYKGYEFEGRPYSINIDAGIPNFDVSAVTVNTSGQQINYSLGNVDSWSSSDITFYLNNVSNCVSPVTFEYSESGAPYSAIENGGSVFRVSSTTTVRFRARNAANAIFESQNFTARIDTTSPQILIAAKTPDPHDITRPKKSLTVTALGGGNFLSEQANGSVDIEIYNKNSNGTYVDSKAPLTYKYALQNADGSFGAYVEMNASVPDGNKFYFVLSSSITSGVLITRTYKFIIESRAGLSSGEVIFTVDIVYPDFIIDVLPINLTPNASGWMSSAVHVEVRVPSDSVNRNGQYTIPRSKYTFFYGPTNITDLYYSCVGTYVRTESDNISIYSFKIDNVSADSTFSIYAENGAGRRCNVPYVTPMSIRIDVNPPDCTLSANVKSESSGSSTSGIPIISGQWVNGRVEIVLRVTNGISGVYVREKIKATNPSTGALILDANGKPIWNEQPANLPISTIDMEGSSVVYVYRFEKGIDDRLLYTFSEEYCYVVYTNSGISREVRFVVNIDISNIILEKIAVGDSAPVSVGGASTVTLDAICNDTTITLFPNSEQAKHFVYYLKNANGQFVRYDSNIIEINIDRNASGFLRLEFYIESKAVNYLGGFASSSKINPYVIIIPFDTLNITIQYELSVSDTIIENEQWYTDALSVNVWLTRGEFGELEELSRQEKESYRYFYLRIPAGSNINDAINIANQQNKWVAIPHNPLNYSTIMGHDVYSFTIDFLNDSFFGYIALSVTNGASFRSSTGAEIVKLLRIDRTTPSLTAVIPSTGISPGEPNIAGESGGLRYYSTNTITISAFSNSQRSPISYYFVRLREVSTNVFQTVDASGNPITVTAHPVPGGANNNWTPLTSYNFTDLSGGRNDSHIMLYAVNANTSAGGFINNDPSKYMIFTFVVDPSPIAGRISFDLNEGAFFDQSLNMYAYKWTDARVYLNIEQSGTLITFYYMRDDDPYERWLRYEHPVDGILTYRAGEIHELLFNATLFPEGVKTGFTFKAVNLAGAEFTYPQKLYIAIDRVFPDFYIELTAGGDPYDGGSTNLYDLSGAWSPIPVLITIKHNNNNVSGVIVRYTLTYRSALSTPTIGPFEIPSGGSFSTDRLDGFNKNMDAILTVFVYNKSSPDDLMDSHSVRLRVDTVKPVFTLTGAAIETSKDRPAYGSSPVYIKSGDWTNRSSVEISRTAVSTNVSPVTYTYYKRILTDSAEETGAWSDGEVKTATEICIYTVIARNWAGLESDPVEFRVNIDIIVPLIRFSGNLNVVEGEKHYIDLRVYIEEENLEICEYITVKGDTRGLSLDPKGYIISTSSVDNSTRIGPDLEPYRGYVRIRVKDYAGNEASFWFYMLPFGLDINNVTLSETDRNQINKYEADLNLARGYMDSSRVVYFETLIAHLRDRLETVAVEIRSFQNYLEQLARRESYELASDYDEMFAYFEQYNNYAAFGQAWIQDAIIGDASSLYNQYFRDFTLAFATLQGKMDQVYAVEQAARKLPAVNRVEVTDYDDVLTAYFAYEGLRTDQRAKFRAELYDKILKLKKKCEIMLLTDASGVALDGNFAPKATIQVDAYKAESAEFINAQKAIWNAFYDEDNRVPCAVFSVTGIRLTDATSQTHTGLINFVLPIPADAQKYVYFAVYKIMGGTVSKIDTITISGDGKSISFADEDLATFAVAALANITLSDTSDNIYGTFLGLELDKIMIRNFIIIGAVLLGVIIIIVIIMAVRQRKFLNSYNKAYRSTIYRKRVQKIPKGNTLPRRNPKKPDERVKTPESPYGLN